MAKKFSLSVSLNEIKIINKIKRKNANRKKFIFIDKS